MARVVIINDEPDLVELCAIVLRTHGHEVRHTVAPHRMSELVALAKWKPDLVLLDLVLPGTDGEGVLGNLRTLPGTAHVPVLVMSAVPEAEARAREMGAIGFVEKPFGPDRLARVVDAAIATSVADGSRRPDATPDSTRHDSQR